MQNTVLKMSLVIFESERRSMNIYGYCRISTAKQSIDRQIRNIKAEYPTAHIVQEAYTGTSIFRPEWLKLYRVLKAGDMVVFDSVSRMSRNAEEGFALYEDLYLSKTVRSGIMSPRTVYFFIFPVLILSAFYFSMYLILSYVKCFSLKSHITASI